MPSRDLIRRLKVLGTIFLIAVATTIATPSAFSTDVRILHTFSFRDDGGNPAGGLIVSPEGTVIYGTTEAAGKYHYGTVFQLAKTNEGWREKVIHDFGTANDGWYPKAGLTLRAGHLYGTTLEGGLYGYGTVFELETAADGQWVERTLHAFDLNGEDFPASPLTFDGQGNLYGTASLGGPNSPFGAVFELVPPKSSGAGWTENVVYNFLNEDDGAYPDSALIVDRRGNLYGTSYFAGIQDNGTIYELSKMSNSWQESTLYEFMGGADGGHPNGPLIMGPGGTLYGTTEFGGESENGVVFQLSKSPSGWMETIVYTFNGGSDGSHPAGGLSVDSAGNLYGTTTDGGTAGVGTIFKLSRDVTGKWTETVLYSFSGTNDGMAPMWGVAPDINDTLYGISNGGTPCGCGLVFAYADK